MKATTTSTTATASAAELANALINSFGKPAETLALLSADIQWSVYAGSQLQQTHQGLEAAESLMNSVFGDVYQPASVATEALQVIGNEAEAAIRFRLTAVTTWGASYDNNYGIFLRCQNGKISEIHELLDSLAASEQLAASAPEDMDLS